MAYLALYRRYRPSTFDKLIGQEHVVQTLKNQIENGRIGHAYLFTGARGTGKTSVAKIFAKAINCTSAVNGSPCGVCECCKALSDPSNIDVIEIDAASNNGVNEIRELRENVQFPPVSCKYKVYIIDEVHMLTGAAFNALLKTLEEPPKHAIFILATTEVHKIPQTILSRCMRFDFRLISTEKIEKVICDIYDKVGKKYQKEAVWAIATAGEGSIRDALSIADTALSYSDGVLTYKDVNSLLGASDFQSSLELVRAILSGKEGNVLDKVDNYCNLGKNFGVLIKDICAFVRNVIVAKSCDDAQKILGLPNDQVLALKEISNNASKDRLIRILEIFTDAEASLRYTTHPRIIFETSAIKATRPDSDYDIDALLARIKELEKRLNSIEQGGQVVVKKEVVESVEFKEKPIVNTVKNISEDSADTVKGNLLFGLRNNNEEMLWNIMQTVTVAVKGNSMIITTKNSGDDRILDTDNGRSSIYNALKCYRPFEIVVNASQQDKLQDKVEVATDKIKSIFGDDIVIVKD